MVFENVKRSLSADTIKILSNAGVTSEEVYEDNVTYISLTLPKGGDKR